MDTPAPEASFGCGICGEIAGRVRLACLVQPLTDTRRPAALAALVELDALARPEGQACLVVETFFGVASHPVSGERSDAVADAIAHTDAPALFRIGYSYAPFCCPECQASYCGDHWDWQHFDDDPFNGVEATCPCGHFQVLAF